MRVRRLSVLVARVSYRLGYIPWSPTLPLPHRATYIERVFWDESDVPTGRLNATCAASWASRRASRACMIVYTTSAASSYGGAVNKSCAFSSTYK